MCAVKEAESIGIGANRAVDYAWTGQGTDALYGTVTAAACSIKNCTIDSLNVADTYNSLL